jgi:hypothetical protein
MRKNVMKTILLAAGVAAIALSGGQALAAPKSMGVTEPKQPIPYAQLNAYMKASPRQKSTKDWWSGQNMASAGTTASTGAAANAAATTTAGSDVRSTPDATPSAAAPDASPSPTAPDATAPSTGSVNPVNPPPTPGAAPSTTPPK